VSERLNLKKQLMIHKFIKKGLIMLNNKVLKTNNHKKCQLPLWSNKIRIKILKKINVNRLRKKKKYLK